jgi:DNA-binding MurR/RpiR family transcriptional regulator
MRVRDMLSREGLALTKSEARIVQILLTDYPVSGLGTATGLARRAGVSDPTVIRLVTKLGFKGFPDFQAKLLEDVEAGLRSPLMMMEAKRPTGARLSVAEDYLHSVARVVQQAANMTVPQAYERSAGLVLEAKGEVLVLGGRFSRHAAGMLASYLAQIRPRVVPLGPLSPETFDKLLDLGPRDVLIVFDYRRYQTDVIRFAEQAAERGVRLVLFTDPWRSPLADKAEVVIVSPVEAKSPYDSVAAPVAQMEALVTHILAEKTQTMHARVQELEKIRTANNVTIAEAKEAVPARKAPSRKKRQ